MSEAPGRGETRRTSNLILAAAGVVAVAVGVYLIAASQRKPEAPSPAAQTNAAAGAVSKNLASGAMAAFVFKPNRPAVADLEFADGSGRAKRLSEWRGRIVLVNLWATWCAPCREEMPSLAALEQALGSKDFEVVAVSLDRKGAEVAGAFLKDTGANDLALYVDTTAATLDRLQAIGLPASVLIDRQGNEIGRMLGPADWSSPEALALVRAAVVEARN